MSKKHTSGQEERIEELVETRTRGLTAGICGREWCERCGQLGSFSGFCGALGSHLDYYRFTCWQCRTGHTDAAWASRHQGLDDLILERGFRYCGGCGREVILGEHTLAEVRKLPFTCPACEGHDRGKAARRRYLEHEARQEGGLDRAESYIRWAKEGLEVILDGSDDDAEM